MRLYIPSNAISTLESFLKYSEFQLVTSPEIYFREKTYVANFDAVLTLDGTANTDEIVQYAIAANIPVYGINRYTKNEQVMMLAAAGIGQPDTWFSSKTMTNSNDVVSLLTGVSDTTRLVMKYNLGARGLGQMLLTKRELIDVFDSDSSDIAIFMQKYGNSDTKTMCIKPLDNSCIEKTMTPMLPEINNNDMQVDKLKNIRVNSHSCLDSALRNGKDFIIQKYIANREEWRMLWFLGQKPIIIKRYMDTDSWQANACNNSVGSSVMDIDSISVRHEFDYNVIDKFLIGTNSPFMSIDIYLDKDTNQWGIFEFQMEFGWTNSVGIDSSMLNEKIIKSVRTLIKQNQKAAI